MVTATHIAHLSLGLLQLPRPFPKVLCRQLSLIEPGLPRRQLAFPLRRVLGSRPIGDTSTKIGPGTGDERRRVFFVPTQTRNNLSHRTTGRVEMKAGDHNNENRAPERKPRGINGKHERTRVLGQPRVQKTSRRPRRKFALTNLKPSASADSATAPAVRRSRSSPSSLARLSTLSSAATTAASRSFSTDTRRS